MLASLRLAIPTRKAQEVAPLTSRSHNPHPALRSIHGRQPINLTPFAMKKFLFPVSMFFAGLILGVGAMFIVQKHATQIMIDQCNEVVLQQGHAAVLTNVIYATLLHDQKYADLNGLIEIDMVAALNSMKAPDFMDRFQSSAKLVRGYYDLPGTEIPGRLASSLAGVKGTDVRHLASIMADPKTVSAVRDMQ